MSVTAPVSGYSQRTGKMSCKVSVPGIAPNIPWAQQGSWLQGEDMIRSPNILTHTHTRGKLTVFRLLVGHWEPAKISFHNTKHRTRGDQAVSATRCASHYLRHTALKLTYANLIYLHLYRHGSTSTVL